jgi:hypothetical protein
LRSQTIQESFIIAAQLDIFQTLAIQEGIVSQCVGKTVLATALAYDSEVGGRFPMDDAVKMLTEWVGEKSPDNLCRRKPLKWRRNAATCHGFWR